MHNCAEEEIERLRQLAELAIIEAPTDPLMERVCALACSVLSVPMAFVTVLDEANAHVLACQGLVRGAVPREQAFCDLTVRRDEPLVIPDTAADPRFRDNPLVTGGPCFRFYAGVPLAQTRGGARLGAFCIGDQAPRDLGPAQIELLQSLAMLVVGQITHHASRRELGRQAIDLARKQEILTQSERLAKVGGFEMDPTTGAMMWSDELRRVSRVDGKRTPTLESFLGLFEHAGRRALRKGFARLARRTGSLDTETVLCGDDGSELQVHVHAEAAPTPYGVGKIIGIVQDVTVSKAMVRTLEWTATHDCLTKLLNRAAFNERIEAAVRLARAFDHRVALVMLDLDRFKTINDSLGHDAGDAVLAAVAERLSAAVGPRGTVARLGGDEFGILIGRVETDADVNTLATEILLRLRQPFCHAGHELSTRATLGVALSSQGGRRVEGFQVAGFQPESCSAASLFKDADIALYNAKQAGRDGFAFYRHAMRDALEDRTSKLAIARTAVLADRIEPWYQPQIDLDTGAIVGFEALLRWHHPTKGLSAPSELGDAFGDTELATAIGRGMLSRVAADMRDWRGRGLVCGKVAINAAEAEFQDGAYAERLLDCLAAHGLARQSIEVEVTESVFLGHHSGIVATTLRALADAGISIALDDFGTGYASLTHLKQHPVHWIKIDRGFVVDIETSRNAVGIVDAVMSLARSLGIGVVAEGIETRVQLELLRARGCAVGQGYLFAKPMPGSRVPYFLRNWTSPWDGEAMRVAAVG